MFYDILFLLLPVFSEIQEELQPCASVYRKL